MMSMAHSIIRGVYAVTPDEPVTKKLTAQVSEALAGGIRLLQYRNKIADRRLAREQACALRNLAVQAGAQLIINDDIELALAVSAHGVHLGREDIRIDGELVDIHDLRRRAWQAAHPNKCFLVGISCYDQMDAARAASLAGADYVAFGSFFSSPTKPDAVRAEMSLIQHAKRELMLPVVAIGGITAENAPQLIAAGVNAVAVISSLFGAEDIRSRARFLSSLFPENV